MDRHDRISGSIFTALGVSIFILTNPFPSLGEGHPGPALFPNILATLFIIFGLLLILKTRKSSGAGNAENSAAEPAPPKNVYNAFFALGIVVAFMILEARLGFLLTSVILLFLLMKKLGTSALKSIILSVLLTFFTHFLFYKILRVPLSPGLLGW